MESYRIMSVLHVLVVIVGLGAPFALPFMQAFAERTSVGATRFFLRFNQRLDKMLIYPAAVLVPILGIGLIFDDATGYKDDFPAWLMVATTLYVVVLVALFFVERRAVADALAAIETVPDDGAFPASYLAAGRRLQMVGGFLGLGILVIGFLMVYGAKGGF